MALCALQRRVHSGQRIIRIQRMVESHGWPCGCVVTRIAGSWKSDSRVIWICRALEVGLVTAEAGRRQRRVVVVGMALRARNCCMRTGQRENRCVVKARRRPGGRSVAERAVARKS